MGVERVLPAELHERYPEAVYVKSEVPADAGDEWGWAWADDELYGFAGRWRGRVGWLTVDGPVGRAAELFAAALAELPARPAGFTLPRGGDRLLPSRLGIRQVDHWDFRWISAAPSRQEWEHLVTVEPRPDNEELTKFLAETSPSHSVQPGDPKIRRWVTVRDDDGSLLATGADTRRPSTGVAHLASIATLPSVRGRGLGAAVTAWLTRRILKEGAGIVTLGLYADNGAARRLYTRLGFSPGIAYSSGRFVDTEDTVDTEDIKEPSA